MVERTLPWPNGYRGPRRRHGRRAAHFASFVALAAALVRCRGLTEGVVLLVAGRREAPIRV